MSDGRNVRVILDQGVPRDAARLLRDRGYECTHVSDIGMSKASDREIIDQALNAGAIAVTLDADFHALLAVSGAAGPSVIRIRREGLDAQALTGIVDKVLVEYALDLAQGSLITVKLNKTTSHQLPIGRR